MPYQSLGAQHLPPPFERHQVSSSILPAEQVGGDRDREASPCRGQSSKWSEVRLGSDDRKRGGREPDPKAEIGCHHQQGGSQAHALTQPSGGPRVPEVENRDSLLDYQSLLRPAPAHARLWMKLEPLQ